MKVIKDGKNMKILIEIAYSIECKNCGCVFEYERKDIMMGGRNETFVKCPNRTCHNRIEV